MQIGIILLNNFTTSLLDFKFLIERRGSHLMVGNLVLDRLALAAVIGPSEELNIDSNENLSYKENYALLTVSISSKETPFVSGTRAQQKIARNMLKPKKKKKSAKRSCSRGP